MRLGASGPVFGHPKVRWRKGSRVEAEREEGAFGEEGGPPRGGGWGGPKARPLHLALWGSLGGPVSWATDGWGERPTWEAPALETPAHSASLPWPGRCLQPISPILPLHPLCLIAWSQAPLVSWSCLIPAAASPSVRGGSEAHLSGLVPAREGSAARLRVPEPRWHRIAWQVASHGETEAQNGEGVARSPRCPLSASGVCPVGPITWATQDLGPSAVARRR